MPPRFRSDHIGSLIRPQYLLDAQANVLTPLAMHNAVDSSADPKVVQTTKEAEKKAIAALVQEEVARGVVPITSGEFDRVSFVAGFFESLQGIEIQFKDMTQFRTAHPITRPYIRLKIPARDQPVAVGKVAWERSAYIHELQYLQSLLPKERWGDIKITLPSPTWSHDQLKDGEYYSPAAYSNRDEYLSDMAKAVRQEILALYEAGARFIQIDDPMFAMMVDSEYQEAQKAEGITLEDMVNPSVAAHRMAIRDLPEDLIIAMHLCRGNVPKGSLVAVGGYDDLASRLFNEMPYKRFALEYDSELTGTFSPLKHLPMGKVAVLGLVTTKDAELEDMAVLKQQVFDAADIIAKAHGKSREDALRDNLAVSPSCGFSSVATVRGTGVDETVQWQKLKLVKDLADEIWGDIDN